MKNPERIAQLLAELRELTDNDFERHRIDVLERDLTSPPQVEVIDDTHQRFNGVVYRETVKKHYGVSAQIHRDVWSYFYGEIPNGYHIHHIDGDPANNAITNLQCLTSAEHARRHGKLSNPIKKIYICATCGKKFEGYANSKTHYCEECSHPFKICAYCDKPFRANYRQQKFCSTKCSARYQFKGHRETRTCPVCGKQFEVAKNRPTICCSISCGNKYDWQRRKSNH